MMKIRTFVLATCCVFSAATAHAACNTSITASTTDKDLTDNGNGTVTQQSSMGGSQTLTWKKCLEGIIGKNCESGTANFFTWEDALKRPRIVNADGFAGFNDWRLPTVGELRSLVDEQCYAPAINSNRFPNTPSWNVWSVSPFADYPGYAWHVDFYYGFAYITPKYGRLAVRLVRTGSGSN